MQTDWNSLIKEIERGNCVLFLGHGLITDAAGVPMYTTFCDQLAKDLESLIHTYYPEENFYLFKALRNRRRFSNQIDDFYAALQPDAEVYRMLAEIPVSLYISISPDNFLEKAIGGDAQVAFYGDAQKRGMEAVATKEQPLIYHIFGSTQDSSSLLLSHDDLFDFFKVIFSGQGLPEAAKKFFKEDAGGEVVFLGFSFRKWYLQLLLRLFNLSRTDNELNRTAYLNNKLLDDEIAFATQHFQIDFIESNIKEFVTILHQKCKEKGILRQLSDTKKEATVILHENKKQRITDINKLLLTHSRLRTEWEEKQLVASDPKESLKCEIEIDKLNEEISKLKVELFALAS
jgi:hypothetical protein